MRINDWGSDVCSSDLVHPIGLAFCGIIHHAQRHKVMLGPEMNMRGAGRDAANFSCNIAGAGLDLKRDLPRSDLPVDDEHDGRVVTIILLEINFLKRSEERSVGKGCVSTCRSRGSA